MRERFDMAMNLSVSTLKHVGGHKSLMQMLSTKRSLVEINARMSAGV